jgi:glycosyltransferase involved in cell wall biosynthesis
MAVGNIHITLTPFSNESRLLKETDTLLKFDVVDRICIVARHQAGLEPAEVLDAQRQVRRVVLRSRNWPNWLFGQLVKYVEFAWCVFVIARDYRAEIFNVHHVALLPIGALLKLFFGGRLVYDAHELETEAVGLRGLRKLGAKLIERLFIRLADLVIVVSPGIELWYREHYPRAPIVTIFNFPHYEPRRRSSLLRERLGIPADRRIALYQGMLTTSRGVENLINGAAQLEAAGYAVVFMGYGPLVPLVNEAAARSPNIYLQPAVPPREVMPYTSSAQTGFAWMVDSCLSYRLCLPNKLFEYIMARIPVITSKLPEMQRIVEDGALGACLAVWEADALKEALATVDAMRGEELDARLDAAAEKYCWENQESTLISAYRKHVLGPSGSTREPT